MDKYDLNMKIERLRKFAKSGNYTDAMTIADSIDWRRISSVGLLTLVADIYEKNAEFHEAKEILHLAEYKAPNGKRIFYKLTLLSLREGNIEEAETYYRSFCEVAREDPVQNILRYMILKAKDAPPEQLIAGLEAYCRTELDERWMYELAELYHHAGRHNDCVAMCDRIMLLFGIGPYVDAAMDLKTNGEGVELNDYQKTLLKNRSNYADSIAPSYDDEQDEQDMQDEQNTQDEYDVIIEQHLNDIVVSEKEDPVLAKTLYTVNFIVERKTPKAGLDRAIQLLRLMHQHTGSTNQVTKIRAEKLNEAGVFESADRIEGKDLIIEEAGDLNYERIEEIMELIRQEPDKRIVVLIDNPLQLKKITGNYPELTKLFHIDREEETGRQTAAPAREETAPLREKIIEKTPQHKPQQPESQQPESQQPESQPQMNEQPQDEMDIDEFAQYASEYAKSIDCSISGKSMLAMYERIEIMEEDGIPLTKENAIDLIEEAADRAEKRSLGNLFSPKYDKNDMLILKEEHFIV